MPLVAMAAACSGVMLGSIPPIIEKPNTMPSYDHDDPLGNKQRQNTEPKGLATDTAFKTRQEIFPVHIFLRARSAIEAPAGFIPENHTNRKWKFQSLNNSLIEVLERVFSSTRLTITAQ